MIFARLLDPVDFGLIGMVGAVTGVVGLLKDFGLSTATIQRDSVTEEQLSGMFWINLGLGIVLWLLCVAIAPVLVGFYHEPRLFWITIATAAGFFFTAVSVQHSALMQRQMRFGTLAVIEVLALLSSTAIGLSMAILGMGYWSLVAWSVALPAGNCLGVWMAARWLPGPPRQAAGILSLLHFGGLVTFNIFVMQVAYNLDKVLLGRYWGAEVLGVYGRAYQITNMATDNLLTAIGAVAFPALSRVQNDPINLKSYFLKGYKLVFTMALPVGLACLLFAEEIVGVMLGEKWMDAAPILRLLSPFVLTHSLALPLGWLLYSLGLVGRSVRIAFAILALVSIGYVAGLSFGAAGVAAGFSVVSILWIVPHFVWATRQLPVSPWDLFLAIRSPCIAAIAAAIPAYVVHAALDGVLPLARLLAGGTTLVLVYSWVLLWVLHEKTFYLGLIRSLRGDSASSQIGSVSLRNGMSEGPPRSGSPQETVTERKEDRLRKVQNPTMRHEVLSPAHRERLAGPSAAEMNAPPPLTPIERVLVAIDDFPLGAGLRTAIGFAILPSWNFLAGSRATDWRLGIWFIAVLIAIRGVPLVLRSVVPFPPGAVAVWTKRRQLAKRFDSYQWRKLLWIGAGMALYLATTQGSSTWETGLAIADIGAGLLGEWAWWVYGDTRAAARR